MGGHLDAVVAANELFNDADKRLTRFVSDVRAEERRHRF